MYAFLLEISQLWSLLDLLTFLSVLWPCRYKQFGSIPEIALDGLLHTRTFSLWRLAGRTSQKWLVILDHIVSCLCSLVLVFLVINVSCSLPAHRIHLLCAVCILLVSLCYHLIALWRFPHWHLLLSYVVHTPFPDLGFVW